jgi:hypothetical protein
VEVRCQGREGEKTRTETRRIAAVSASPIPSDSSYGPSNRKRAFFPFFTGRAGRLTRFTSGTWRSLIRPFVCFVYVRSLLVLKPQNTRFEYFTLLVMMGYKGYYEAAAAMLIYTCTRGQSNLVPHAASMSHGLFTCTKNHVQLRDQKSSDGMRKYGSYVNMDQKLSI